MEPSTLLVSQLAMSLCSSTSDRAASAVTHSNSVTSYVGSTGDPNGATGDLGAAILIQDIEDTRAMLKEIGVDSEIPVGNSDAGSYFSTKVLSAVDYGVRTQARYSHLSHADFTRSLAFKCACLVRADQCRGLGCLGFPVL